MCGWCRSGRKKGFKAYRNQPGTKWTAYNLRFWRIDLLLQPGRYLRWEWTPQARGIYAYFGWLEFNYIAKGWE